jgi:trehalose-6-phosphate synthase
LLVNPYDIERAASVMCDALEMDETSVRRRMRRMRSTIQADNVYRWYDQILSAGTIGDAEMGETQSGDAPSVNLWKLRVPVRAAPSREGQR